MKIIGIIPSRYASTRFPGKPLVDIAGKTMIQRVYEQAQKASLLTEIAVATDDERIFNHVKNFGGKAVMTSPSHQSGTDRCAEVSEKLYRDFDVAINIQGDEPYIHPEQIDELAKCFEDENTLIATPAKKIENTEDLYNPNRIKVVLNKKNEAIYFSRSPIPYCKNAAEKSPLELHRFYKHIGIYGYRIDILKKLTELPQSSLEIAESLEQLRWIENGYKIKVHISEFESVSVDSPDDLKKIFIKK